MGLYEYLFGKSINDEFIDKLFDNLFKNASKNTKIININGDGTVNYYMKGQKVTEAEWNASSTTTSEKTKLNFKKDFVNDSKNLETIKIKIPDLKEYIEKFEENPNTEEKGVFIHANDPTTWNRPGWNNNSSYANSALWAILYNNAYVIKDAQIKTATTDLKVNVKDSKNKVITEKVVTIDELNNNKEIVKENLINFQNAIQNHGTIIESSIILSYTTAIMAALGKITGNTDLINNFFAPDEFLQIINTVFVAKIQQRYSDNLYFPIFILPPKYNLLPTSSKSITISYSNNDGSIASKTDYLENDLIIDYPKLGLSNNVVEGNFDTLSKQRSEKFYSIGNYKLYAFVHWQSGKHYVCYFVFNNEWYQFNDTGNNNKGSIKKVLNLKESEIFNESFLFFYNFDNILTPGKNVTITEYLSTADHTLNITSSETELEDSIQLQEFNPLKKNVSTTFNSTNQLADRCEQYGKEWLNLFINKNAVQGSKTHKDKEDNNDDDDDDDDDDEEDELTDDENEEKITISIPNDDLSSQESFNDDIFVTPDAEELQPHIQNEEKKTNELKAFLNSEELKDFTEKVKLILANLNSINNNKNEKNDEFNEAMTQVKTTIKDLNDFELGIDISDLNDLQKQILTSEVNFLKKKLETLNDNADNILTIGQFVNLLNERLKDEIWPYFEHLINLNNTANANLAELKDSENLNKIDAKLKEIIRTLKNDKLWAPIVFEPYVYDIGDVIFYNGVLYVKLQSDLFYNTTDNTNETTNDITRQKGGTRRRNININGGTRKERRKTRKFIKYKNLKTNKLNTNKLRTIKLKLNKRKTRKAL